jgi:carboxylesterase type B
MPWVPVLDGAFAAEPIVPRDFREAVAAGQAASVPVIMGCCRDEGLILTPSFFKVSREAEEVKNRKSGKVALCSEV